MAKKNKYMGKTATQELINLIQDDFAKKQDIIQFVEMPSYVQFVGRTVQYVGETTAEFIQGHLYHSTGFAWTEVYKNLDGKTWQLTDTLPVWADAEFNVVYYVPNEYNELTAYIKKDAGGFYALGGNGSWVIVSTLPDWADARDDIIYFVDDGVALKLYIKDPNTTDAWHELSGGSGTINYNELQNTPTINGKSTKNLADPSLPLDVKLEMKVKKYPDSDHYDPAAVYPATATDVPVDQIELEAFTDQEIEDLYNEV